MGDKILSVTVRNGRPDCFHYGSFVLVDKAGQILHKEGNAFKMVYERSLVKPYKTIALVESGAADYFSFNSIEIALVSGSHSGTSEHLMKLREMLKKIELNEEALKCGKRLPLGEDALTEFRVNNTELSTLHCDCSGEHIGTLALSKYLGYGTNKYVEIHHPIQTYVRKFVDTFLEYTSADFAIDGCCFPTFYVPLYNLAVGISNLVNCKYYPSSSTVVIKSIVNNPIYFEGFGRFTTRMIIVGKGLIIGKCGAEGLYCLGFINSGWGLAIKISDGNHRGAIPVILSLIKKYNLLSEIEIENVIDMCNIYNNVGEKVGEIQSKI